MGQSRRGSSRRACPHLGGLPTSVDASRFAVGASDNRAANSRERSACLDPGHLMYPTRQCNALGLESPPPRLGVGLVSVTLVVPSRDCLSRMPVWLALHALPPAAGPGVVLRG
jgi:hypothetical protein